MSDTDPLIGQRVAQYEIVRKLGHGGMGVVYLARHMTLERAVAVKFLAVQLATDSDYVDRFLREARAAARLNHPNIIAVYDAGCEEGVYYFVMEFVEGRDAAKLLKERKFFTENEAIDVVRKSAMALAYAHKAGIVHRDIKPENLILTDQGELKVGDLGLAKQIQDDNMSLTVSGVVMGTPYYISPEQIRAARSVDSRTDIYSLGATLFHLVTGVIPYRGTSSAEIMSKHLTEPLPWPQTIRADLSESLCRVIYKMMAKDPDERFQTMEEVNEVLALLQTGQTEQVNASVQVPEHLEEDPALAETQLGSAPSALGMTGAPHQAAPSVFTGQQAPSQSIPGQPQPSIYTIPPTMMANRIAGAIGIAIVLSALLSGVLWFFLLRPPKIDPVAKGPKPDLEELARRAGVLEAPRENEVARKMETQGAKEAVIDTPKAPLPPQEPMGSAPVTPPSQAVETETKPLSAQPEAIVANEKKLAETPAQPEAMARTPAPSATEPRLLLQNDFDHETAGSLPQGWKAYIQETVPRGEKAKDPYWSGTTQYVTPDGTAAIWEIFKTLEAYDGSQVLRIASHPAAGQTLKYRNGINGTLHVQAGKKYTLIFHARAGSDPIKVSLRVGIPGVAVRNLAYDLIDEWKEERTQFEPARDGDISISIILTSPGELWLDEIQILETQAA